MIRFFDILFSTVAIVILFPLFLIVMVLLKLTGEHEIFYLQKRMGRLEKSFNIIKFATMLKDSVNMSGGAVTKKHDSRVLPIGKFLRKTKINELPQLFNIWIGNMSIVGPRPLTIEQYHNYSEAQRKYISELKPGLTGIGSLIFRDEEEIMERSGMDYNKIHDTIIADYKGDLECWFHHNNSLRKYFLLILFTALSVVKPNLNFQHRFKNLPEPKGILKDLING
ncbi:MULTISPECIES: sugar transferase [unclassified Oceanispirochaeta]|uniref:sugar transferase n=1 Tax=unclassified Oceanispirochaeta TaxID=2635722 RepID=UPI000E09A8CE|nr:MULTISPECIES: sugar transferase [unclassified Oceanispirochaeta]MBF9017755.1 sugar transferase [Oceanispirochaeta sp. M2]NPD74319.1 sugar transferase [Oceanispirochaeta sp. M1]RDG29800.1 sugar transferase [Oceanispirochaeta sp. M1]